MFHSFKFIIRYRENVILNFTAIWTTTKVTQAAGNQSKVKDIVIMEDVRSFCEVCTEFLVKF